MATFLDAFGALQNFSAIFVFLFVFSLIFGLLSYAKFLGDNKGINAMIAFVVAILFTLSKTLVRATEYIAPWFVMLVLFAILIILMFRFIGASEADITQVIKHHNTIITFVFVFVIVIVVLSFGQVLKEQAAEGNVTTTFPAKVGAVLQHPTVLGLIAILMIAVWTIRFLSENTE